MVGGLTALLLAARHWCAAATPEATCPAGESCAETPGGKKGEGYFDAYGTAYVQAEMLQDEVRTKAYRDAILDNRHLFEGKVVLDVGAGTGILSFFAAQAGAARVIAVERSDMAHIARQIAKDNNLHQVEVVHGLLEEVTLPEDSVDIIVSEWIGTFLIHESMLDSVLFARDRWLKPGGLILPDSSTLVIGGLNDQFADLEQWKDFYGLNFTALGAAWRGVAAQQCAIRRSIVTEPVVLMELDLYSMKVTEQEFTRQFSMKVNGTASMHAMAAWFTCGFYAIPRPGDQGSAKPSVLSTHPDDTCTHWQQTFFFLPHPVPLKDVEHLPTVVKVGRSPGSPRDLSVRLSVGDIEEDFVIVGAEY